MIMVNNLIKYIYISFFIFALTSCWTSTTTKNTWDSNSNNINTPQNWLWSNVSKTPNTRTKAS